MNGNMTHCESIIFFTRLYMQLLCMCRVNLHIMAIHTIPNCHDLHTFVLFALQLAETFCMKRLTDGWAIV